MTKLYELTGSIKDIENLITDGDISREDAYDTIHAINMEFDQKAEGIVKVLANYTPDIEAIDSEIRRLTDRKKTMKAKEEWLKDYLRDNMQAADKKKIETELFTITLRAPSKSVQIDNEDAIPDEFVAVKTVTSPDKKAILAALKDGQEIAGASIKESKPALQIK